MKREAYEKNKFLNRNFRSQEVCNKTLQTLQHKEYNPGYPEKLSLKIE